MTSANLRYRMSGVEKMEHIGSDKLHNVLLLGCEW